MSNMTFEEDGFLSREEWVELLAQKNSRIANLEVEVDRLVSEIQDIRVTMRSLRNSVLATLSQTTQALVRNGKE